MVRIKKTGLAAGSVFGFFLVLVVVQLMYSFKGVKNFQHVYGLNIRQQSGEGWSNPEVNRIKKDILWYEQLLKLSKSDSIYLAINLQDSVVQLKLKGMYLAEAKIVFQYPYDFLKTANEETYRHFATVSAIHNETANLPKKPVRKVVAYSYENENGKASVDTTEKKQLKWMFITEDNLRVIISGVKTASGSSHHFHPKQDVLQYRMQDVIRDPFPEHYMPTLYLWLYNQEATAIYRAVPPGGKLLFRN